MQNMDIHNIICTVYNNVQHAADTEMEASLVSYSYNHFIQLLSRISSSSFSGEREERLLLHVWPAIENSLSHGTLVAGTSNNFLASLTIIGRVVALSDHHLIGSLSCADKGKFRYNLSSSSIRYLFDGAWSSASLSLPD